MRTRQGIRPPVPQQTLALASARKTSQLGLLTRPAREGGSHARHYVAHFFTLLWFWHVHVHEMVIRAARTDGMSVTGSGDGIVAPDCSRAA